MGHRNAAVLTVALLAVLILGAWGLFMLNTKQQASAAIVIDLPLILHRAEKDGAHSYSGSIFLPSACDTLSNGISTQGVNPAHITIRLSADRVACKTAAKTESEFLVSLTNSDEMPPIVDAVTFNGLEIPYTLVEDK